MAYFGWFMFGLLGGAGGLIAATRWRGGMIDFAITQSTAGPQTVPALVKEHFFPTPVEEVTISARQFPHRIRADLQRAVDALFDNEATVHRFLGVRKEYSHEAIQLTDCLIASQHYPTTSIPPEYEDIDIGEPEPVRALKNGLWLLERDGCRCAVLMTPAGSYGRVTGMELQVAAPNTVAGTRLCRDLLARVEKAVEASGSYRGKILSLEKQDDYSGQAGGVKVHTLRRVEREQVILPDSTLDLLDRNVVRFVQQREGLTRLGLPTKKGVLFYGPPGTGKTHTIHYLTRSLADHTTLLIAAEQVGLLDDYLVLARLLQPSIVVIEDADLIAREREKMDSVCEEVLLNKLLNEMDGLRADADILFVLTTNRPETLEEALASRPGRVDQAIEFPLPDESGRRKLLELYARGLELPQELAENMVRRTEGVSAAFIKELVRRVAQYTLERKSTQGVSPADVDNALQEMLSRSGSLNKRLLGAAEADG